MREVWHQMILVRCRQALVHGTDARSRGHWHSAQFGLAFRGPQLNRHVDRCKAVGGEPHATRVGNTSADLSATGRRHGSRGRSP